MSFYSYFRVSKPSAEKVSSDKVEPTYRKYRSRTFWTVTIAYALFYMCRMAFSIVKQPIIDGGIMDARHLGVIGSSMLFVYAIGKFVNGFISDYCNVRRFMAAGLGVSALVNLTIGILGLCFGWFSIPVAVLFGAMAVLWGINGWVQSMGSPMGVISLSRWYPKSIRGTYYSIFSATPNLGKMLSMIIIGGIVGWAGWQWGFIAAAIAGFIGMVLILLLVNDTPESIGLPSVQEISGEGVTKADKMPTKELQKFVIRHPGVWIIALSTALMNVTQYAFTDWGVLFLQKHKDFTLNSATQVIAIAGFFGIAGTVVSGWLSDKVFKGDRIKPVLLSGIICSLSFGLFLFGGGSYLFNIACAATFFLCIGILFCIVAGLMALDIVPRKATGAATGIIGISSYVAAGIQDVASGFIIQSGVKGDVYDFKAVSIFWLCVCLLSFIIPILGWSFMKKKVVE